MRIRRHAMPDREFAQGAEIAVRFSLTGASTGVGPRGKPFFGNALAQASSPPKADNKEGGLLAAFLINEQIY